MIRRKALWRTRQPLSFQAAKKSLEFFLAEDSPQLLVMIRNVVANREDLLRPRHIDSARDQDLLGGDMKVKTCRRVPGNSARVERGRNPDLVRRLVGAESDVAVYAIDISRWVHDDLRRELVQLAAELLHQSNHRQFHLRLVDLLVRAKPFAVVVPLELTE